MDHLPIFSRTSYLQALKGNANFESEKKIEMFIRKRPFQYQYGDVLEQEFKEKYNSKGWLARKVIAIPAALWVILFKTIYHIVEIAFMSIPKHIEPSRIPTWFSSGERDPDSTITDELLKTYNVNRGQYLKSWLRRDLQEARGKMISLYDDRKGVSIVEESQYHKTCYEIFMHHHKKLSSLYFGSEFFSGLNEGIKTNGRMIRRQASWNLDGERTCSISQLYHKLQFHGFSKDYFYQLPRSSLNLEEFLYQTHPEILKLLTWKDLIIPLKDSKFRFAAMDDEAFNKLTIRDIQNEQSECLTLIKARLQLSKKGEANSATKFIDDTTILDIPLGELSQISTESF